MNKAAAHSELLIAGASDYPQAFAAVSEFVRSVKTMLQEAVEAEVPHLSNSMAVHIPKELKFRLHPSKIGTGEADGVNAKIGFAIWGDPDWRQYFYVNWDEGTGAEKTLSLSVTVKFLRDMQAPVLAKAKVKTTKVPFQIEVEGKEVYIWRPIAQSDIVSLGSTMREMLKVWADAWRDAGGLKSFLTKAS